MKYSLSIQALVITFAVEAIKTTQKELNLSTKKPPLLISLNTSSLMVDALLKDKSYIISKKYPDQNYLQANYFVEYGLRPREELPDPVNGADRYDGYLVFVVIGEYGIYMKKLERRWLDIPTNEKKEGGEMKPVLEVGEDSRVKIIFSQMNSNETVLSIAYSNLTIQVLQFKYDSNSSSSGYELRELYQFNLRYRKPLPISEGDEQIRSIGGTPYSDYLIVSPNRFEIFKINRRSGERESKMALLDSTRLIVCPVATFKHKDNPHSPNRIQRPWISDHNHKIGTEKRCILTGHDSPTNVVVDWTNMKAVSYWDLGLMGGSPHDEDNIIHSMTFFGGIPSASLYVFTTRKPESFVYLVSTIYKARYLHRYLDFQHAGSKVVNWVNGTLFIGIYIKDSTDTFPSGSQLAFIKVFGSFPLRQFTGPISELSGKGIEVYQQAKIFLQMGAEDENENQLGLEDLDEYYLGYYILSNNLEVGASIMSWSHCKEFRAPNVDSLKKTETNLRFTYGRHRTCRECSKGFLPAEGFAQEKNTNKTIINCIVEKCSSNSENTKSTVLTIEEEVKFSTSGSQFLIQSDKFKMRRCVPRYTLDEDEKGFANDNGCPPGFNRDPFGLCRKCQTPSGEYSSNCLFFINYRLVKEDYSFNIQNFTVDKLDQAIPFKGHKSLMIELPEQLESTSDYRINYKSLYFWDRVSGIFIKLGTEKSSLAIVWQGQEESGSELCYKLSSTLKTEEGYKVQPARNYRLGPMEDYPWFDVSQQKKKYPGGALQSTICFKTCPVGYYYDFESISCRRCGIGCAECQRREFCKMCIPGYSMVKEPKFRPLSLDIQLNTCVVGCQEGFYLKRFDGECLECPKGCELCRDRSSEELAMLTG